MTTDWHTDEASVRSFLRRNLEREGLPSLTVDDDDGFRLMLAVPCTVGSRLATAIHCRGDTVCFTGVDAVIGPAPPAVYATYRRVNIRPFAGRAYRNRTDTATELTIGRALPPSPDGPLPFKLALMALSDGVARLRSLQIPVSGAPPFPDPTETLRQLALCLLAFGPVLTRGDRVVVERDVAGVPTWFTWSVEHGVAVCSAVPKARAWPVPDMPTLERALDAENANLAAGAACFDDHWQRPVGHVGLLHTVDPIDEHHVQWAINHCAAALAAAIRALCP